MRPTPQQYLKDALYNLSTLGVAIDDISPLYPIRNFVRRLYTGEYAWGFRNAQQALVLAPSGTAFVGPAPTNIDEQHPVKVYDIYSGERRDYTRTDFGNIFSTTSTPLFYHDRLNNLIYTNSSSAFVDYQVAVDDLPENASTDTTPDVFPSSIALSWGICEAYVNSLETADDLGKASYFGDKYGAQLGADISREIGFMSVIDVSLAEGGRR